MSFAKSFIAVGLASVLQIGAALAQNGAAQKKPVGLPKWRQEIAKTDA